MPLHTFTFTKADALSCVMFGLYVYQPFVDRAAVMQWIIDNIFFGSLPLTAGWGLSGATSPFTATTLITGSFAGETARHVGLKWNGLYSLLCAAALSVWVLIYAYLIP